MANLNDLTVSLLDKLAKECKIKIKKSDKKTEKIEKIKQAGIDNEKLEKLIYKYLTQKKANKKSSKDIISELKGRIKLLEEQMKFIMSKISVTEVTLAKEENIDFITITSNLGDLKKFIKSLIRPGETITIDEIIEIQELQKIPLVTLKHAIYDLIEEDIFNVSEGTSRLKIGGNIGALQRK